jgi:hypothetical protein
MNEIVEISKIKINKVENEVKQKKNYYVSYTNYLYLLDIEDYKKIYEN